MMGMENKRRRKMRGMGCAFFLLLLAVCGYVGAQREGTRTVSAPVTRSAIQLSTVGDAIAETANRLEEQRNMEIALLREVMADSEAGSEHRENAAAQLIQITERMETEAQSTACLERMGFEGVKAVCGAQMISLIVPAEEALQDDDAARIVEAVSSLTGIEPGEIKIILAKK